MAGELQRSWVWLLGKVVDWMWYWMGPVCREVTMTFPGLVRFMALLFAWFEILFTWWLMSKIKVWFQILVFWWSAIDHLYHLRQPSPTIPTFSSLLCLPIFYLAVFLIAFISSFISFCQPPFWSRESLETPTLRMYYAQIEDFTFLCWMVSTSWHIVRKWVANPT